MKALKDLAFQMDRKTTTAAVAITAVDRTGTTSLRSRSLQDAQAAKVFQHLSHADLSADLREVERGCLDRRRRPLYAGFCRGDHLSLPAWFRFVARDFFVGLFPRIMLGVERLLRFPNRENQVQQLAHAMPQGHVATLALARSR